MAMCFSLVSLLGAPVTINDPKCVAKTFPDYFDALAALQARPEPAAPLDNPLRRGFS